MSILFVPSAGISGDVIPFYWDGEYHLFYIAPRSESGSSWAHIVTGDFVAFKDWGEAIPAGKQDEQDLDIWTGSVIERNGVFHIFYTGHNAAFSALGRPDQVVMHAASQDLKLWTKDKEFFLLPALNRGYEISAWRDPFIFWNQEVNEYWMLLTARRIADTPVQRRGCVALLASNDLIGWELRDPFYAPEEFDTHECPDLFRIGEWWYLVFSTYRGEWTTRYRMSKSLSGPWVTPAVDTFDADGFYAAKTAGDGNHRYIIGWLADRRDKKDENLFAWGGAILGHRIEQQSDGTLSVTIPTSVVSRFSKQHDLFPRNVIGDWQKNTESVSCDSKGRFSLLDLGELPSTFMLEVDIVFGPGTSSCGLLIRSDENMDQYYQLIIDPAMKRIRFMRDGQAPVQRVFAQERPLSIKAEEPVKLRVLVENSVIVIYEGDRVALSGRMYDLNGSHLCLYVSDGCIDFQGLCVKLP